MVTGIDQLASHGSQPRRKFGSKEVAIGRPFRISALPARGQAGDTNAKACLIIKDIAGTHVDESMDEEVARQRVDLSRFYP